MSLAGRFKAEARERSFSITAFSWKRVSIVYNAPRR